MCLAVIKSSAGPYMNMLLRCRLGFIIFPILNEIKRIKDIVNTSLERNQDNKYIH
jgi:hypothetical protein